MSTTLQRLVTQARGLLQDTVEPYRYSNDDLVRYANDALDLMRDVMPAVFTDIIEYTCVVGERQSLSPAISAGLVEVLSTKSGQAIAKADFNSYDNFKPNWRKERHGSACDWNFIGNSRFEFYVYPPSQAGQVLIVRHVGVKWYVISEALDDRLVPYGNLLVDYMVGIAESREAEDTAAQRQQAFINLFVGKLKSLRK